jgi:hypothetical protein
MLMKSLLMDQPKPNLHNKFLFGWLAQAWNLHKGKGYRLHKCKQTAMHQQGAYMINSSQKVTFHKFGSFLFNSHCHSICIFRFIYPPKTARMEGMESATSSHESTSRQPRQSSHDDHIFVILFVLLFLCIDVYVSKKVIVLFVILH